MDSIAQRTSSRKRAYSEIAEDVEGEEIPNFDILKWFPILLCQYVFQHFDGKELMEIGTVNKKWSKLAGERRQLRKLKLVFNEEKPKLTREAKNVLLKSKRQYENIEIKLSYDNLEFLLTFLAKRAGSWKNVKVQTSAAVSLDIWPKILEIIEPSVEKLSIRDLFYPEGNPMDVATSWTFPQLKELNSGVLFHNVFKYFVRVTSLVKCWLSEPLPANQATTSDMRAVLLGNANLMDLTATVRDKTLFDNLVEVKFKLQHLHFDILGQTDSTSNGPIVSFLKTQADNLQWLVLHSQLDQEILKLILGMPRLLAFASRIAIPDEIEELPANSTIKMLGVDHEISVQGRPAYRKLFKALRNLKYLTCDTIDDELLLNLIEDVPALVTLDTSFFNVSRFPEENVFPNLEYFMAFKFNEDLQEPTGNDNFSQLVKKKMKSKI